jgi:hypothetical protein
MLLLQQKNRDASLAENPPRKTVAIFPVAIPSLYKILVAHGTVSHETLFHARQSSSDYIL